MENNTSIVVKERQGIQEIKRYSRSPEVMQRFAEAVGSASAAGSFIQSALLAVAQAPALQECTPDSIMASAMRAATISLYCEPSIGHAYLVPFKDKSGVKRAQLIIGYKGLYQLALRTGKYRYINVSEIYEGQSVDEDQLTGKTTITGKRISSTVIGYVAYIELYTGFSKSLYMSLEEIEAHKKRYSKGYDRQDSAWKTNPEDMARKTVLRLLLSRYGYLDPKAQAVMSTDVDSEDAEVVELSADSLPPAEAVTIIDEQPRTKYSDALLFDEEYVPTPDEIAEHKAAMAAYEESKKPITYDEAWLMSEFKPSNGFSLDNYPEKYVNTLATSNGKRYGSCSIDELAKMVRSATKAIEKEEDFDKRKEYANRRNCLEAVLHYRKEQLIVNGKLKLPEVF